MGKLRNSDDNVTINEVTVSHRATKNSPHDALTWDQHGIRGVSMDGIHVYSNDHTFVRSVNVSIGGVSFECDQSMLDVLSDKEAREKLVTRSLDAHAEKEALESSQHGWSAQKDKSTDGLVAWQCARCQCWVFTGAALGVEDDALPKGGCLGRVPTPEEARQQDSAQAIQKLGMLLEFVHSRARGALQNGADPAAVRELTQAIDAVAIKDPVVGHDDKPAEPTEPSVSAVVASDVAKAMEQVDTLWPVHGLPVDDAAPEAKGNGSKGN